MDMHIEIGVKSDPVEYRYSYEWLFALMRDQGVARLQLGSFFELYSLPDDYFVDLRRLADSYGIAVGSVFTAHRELGGFFSGDPRLERAARNNFERLLKVGALVGARYVGSNPGSVYRDRPQDKDRGLRCYLGHMKELSHLARGLGLEGLTMEPMSCLSEPPSTPDEIKGMMDELGGYHRANQGSTVPVYICGDVSHGVADKEKKVLHGNMELFEYALPWMCEFHFKNTDSLFNSTFGFGPAERERGIVDVREVLAVARSREKEWPVQEVVGYLEIGGPKLGRDYSDHLLRDQLVQSLEYLRSCM
jgi:hypothetical protein